MVVYIHEICLKIIYNNILYLFIIDHISELRDSFNTNTFSALNIINYLHCNYRRQRVYYPLLLVVQP